MGRRSLPKFDPAIDFSGHLLELDAVPEPWDAANLFGRTARLEIEVGSGKGLFLIEASRTMPDTNFLGVELSAKYARFAAYRFAKNGLENVRMLRGDALELFSKIVPCESVDEIHVYFPDPWWKTKHHHRRVFSEKFVQDVERALKPAGRLHFWTDVLDYYQSGLALLAEHTGLTGPIPIAEPDVRHDMDYRTHFERRTRKHNEPVYRSEFVKQA